MTLNFYTLSVIYLVYSFLGWVFETVVMTIRGGRFANRGAAAGPFCFIYGTTGVLLAVSFGDLRTEPVYPVLCLYDGGNGDGMDHRQAAGTPAPPQVVGLFRKKIVERLCVPAQYSLWVRWARQVCCGQ